MIGHGDNTIGLRALPTAAQASTPPLPLPLSEQLLQLQSEIQTEINQLHNMIERLAGSFPLPGSDATKPATEPGWLQIVIEQARMIRNSLREINNTLTVL